MLDVFDVPASRIISNQVWTSFSATNGGSWQIWHKPRNATQVLITMRGAGSGGGAGFTGANAAAGGGGGGSGGSYGSILAPAIAIPDVLYISVGTPGNGGVNAAGAASIPSYVSVAPNNTAAASTIILATVGAGGGIGTAVAGGALGSAGAIQANLAGGTGYGYFFQTASQNGTAGGVATTAAPGGTLTLNGNPTTGGTGGGAIGIFAGTGGAGGPITSPNTFLSPSISGGAGGGAVGSSGNAGQQLLMAPFGSAFIATGGTGGGGSTGIGGTNGGNGGTGGPGCGGGGGGAVLTGGVAGIGGRGGIGIVTITCW